MAQRHGGALLTGGVPGNRGGGRPIVHGLRSRYSALSRAALRELIDQHAADPDPLDLLPELAACRALFVDYIDRYAECRDALLLWHLYAREDIGGRLNALGKAKTEKQRLALASELAALLDGERFLRPVQVPDISSAYRLLSEATKIASRIVENKDRRPYTLGQIKWLAGEFGRVVVAANSEKDPAKRLKKIADGWRAITLPARGTVG